MRTKRAGSAPRARSRSARAAPILRVRSWPVTASLLAALLVSETSAGHGAPSVEPSFTPVPTVRPSVRPVDPGADRVIVDVGIAVRPMPSRPVVSVPSPRLRTHVQPSVVPVPERGGVSGTASWYCGNGSPCTRGYPGGLYAAAGPALRRGDWRGRTVVVSVPGRSVTVTLIDACQCHGTRVLDLYRDAFIRLADPSAGLVKVTVTY